MFRLYSARMQFTAIVYSSLLLLMFMNLVMYSGLFKNDTNCFLLIELLLFISRVDMLVLPKEIFSTSSPLKPDGCTVSVLLTFSYIIIIIIIIMVILKCYFSGELIALS